MRYIGDSILQIVRQKEVSPFSVLVLVLFNMILEQGWRYIGDSILQIGRQREVSPFSVLVIVLLI